MKIIKAGLLDTVQDMGRYGHQHLGINPSGAMDRFAALIANMLVGNDAEEAVIELHFPASAVLFEKETIIAITGADFVPAINGEIIPLLHPVLVNKNSVLHFQKAETGTRCYLAIAGGLEITKWLNSYSTNLKAVAGGYNGRALIKNDVINLKRELSSLSVLHEKDFMVLPWKANDKYDGLPESAENILVIPGHEWDILPGRNKKNFFEPGIYYLGLIRQDGLSTEWPCFACLTI